MTFKAKIVANELVDTDVTAVSLVKHAASRAPFKLLKTEDVELAPQKSPLKGAIDHVFGKTDEAEVSFIAIKKGDKDAELIKKLEAAGFATNNAEDHNGVTIYRQQGYVDEVGSMITLSPDVAVGLNEVVKGFDPWPMSTDFNENMGAAQFFPGFYEATYALGDTIHNVLHEALTKTEAQSGIDSALSAFSKHVKGLVKSIPESVIKMELSLQHEFASNTLSPSNSDSTTEDNPVKKAEKNIPEGVAGDLAGLNNVAKTDDVETPVTTDTVDADAVGAVEATDGLGNKITKGDDNANNTPAVETPETPEILTKTRKVMKGEKVVEMQVSYYIDADGVEVETASVEKAEVPAGEGAVLAAIATLGTQITGLGDRMDAIEKSQTETQEAAEAATEAAQNSVVHRGLGDVDQSLGTNRTPAAVEVQKSGADLWAGAMPAFD